MATMVASRNWRKSIATRITEEMFDRNLIGAGANISFEIISARKHVKFISKA